MFFASILYLLDIMCLVVVLGFFPPLLGTIYIPLDSLVLFIHYQVGQLKCF